MRRSIELLILVATAGFLVATSQAHQPCATETITFRAQTSCGPDANVTVSSNASCAIRASGAEAAGLPTVGSSGGYVADAGLLQGFELGGTTPDGGTVYCSARAGDGGMDIRCVPTCYDYDGGCDPGCSGTLTPQ